MSPDRLSWLLSNFQTHTKHLHFIIVSCIMMTLIWPPQLY